MTASSHTTQGNSRTRRLSGRHLVRSLAVVSAGAAMAAVLPAAAASAAVPGDFSPFVPPGVRYVDDCRVEIGPVYDSVPAPNYHKIGGVRVNCSSMHRFVEATVAEEYWNGSRWVQLGASGYGIRYNSYGSGSGLGGILRSQPVCFNHNHGWAWLTVATIRTERVTQTVQSDWATDPSGC